MKYPVQGFILFIACRDGALTIDLPDTVRSTGCLGLSILNSLGVYGGCEGDIPSLLSMAVMGEAQPSVRAAVYPVFFPPDSVTE